MNVEAAPRPHAASVEEPQPAPGWWGKGGPVRRYAPIAAILVATAIVAIVTSRPSATGLPFDPASTDAFGTKALVMTLERVGADVNVLSSTDDMDVDTLLVLVDNLGTSAASRVEQFVEEGGTALVADSSGLLSDDLRPARAQAIGFFEPALPRECGVPALAGVNRVRTGMSTLFAVPDDAVGCYTRGRAAWLIIREQGDGTLVTAGAPTFLTNSMLGEVDNAGLAAAVLAPEPETRVGILRPAFAVSEDGQGSSDQSLVDLIPMRLRGAFLQLLIAFGVLALWRMRRLGKPVSEPQAVRLPGSELVMATGNLLQLTGSRRRAAELLREDFRRAVSQRLGLPHDLPADELADLAAERTGVSQEDILAALGNTVPANDPELVVMAQRLEALRAALSAPVPAGAARVPNQ